MIELKVKTLPDFIEEMIQKYKIPETQNIRKTLRAKFLRELLGMHEWEKAGYRTVGRNRTKVFQFEVLERLETRCQNYLVRKSGFDLAKFKNYKQRLSEARPYEDITEDTIKSIEEKTAFRTWVGSISKAEIHEVMLKALFEKFFTPIDIKQWQEDSDFLTIVDADDDRRLDFEYYKALERYNSYNKSAYYQERKSEE
ncbi:hypothetical protein [Streptococcus plurextorum]|uniref:hypothetical protein n=1 Tax=Streptococcus plurextorum TaxID=456876 RepID=UPI000420A0DE|nr:hypothetical protein [Streptococcus plurextorum]